MNQSLNTKDISSLMKVFSVQTDQTKETIGKLPTRESQYWNKPIPEYLPKRMLKFTPLNNLSLSSIGSPRLNYNNISTFNDSKDKGNENDYLQFRTAYILKYAQIAEFFYKTKKYSDYFVSEEKKSTVSEVYLKIRKDLESQSRLFFNSNPIIWNNEESLAQWKKTVSIGYDINNSSNKYCELLFNELQMEKEQNMKFRKRIFELETFLHGKETELKKVNGYLNRYDVSNRIRKEKQRSDSHENAKESFTHKENTYKINIYRLEEEIRDLTTLLDRNKEFYQNFKECQSTIEQKKKEIEDMRAMYNKELNNKTIEIAINKDNQLAQETKINELEGSIQLLENEVSTLKKDNFEIQLQTKKYQMTIKERNENINMLSEEINTWVYLLEEERNNHDATANALLAMENRFLKGKDKDIFFSK